VTVSELLGEGRSNARTRQELADLLQCNPREVTKRIEYERQQGAAICASVSAPLGYYLAGSREELSAYCGSLDRRLRSITTTRDAIRQTADEWKV